VAYRGGAWPNGGDVLPLQHGKPLYGMLRTDNGRCTFHHDGMELPEFKLFANAPKSRLVFRLRHSADSSLGTVLVAEPAWQRDQARDESVSVR
jgi:hypothetical protein